MFSIKTNYNKKGSVLAYALVILSITMIMLVSLLGYISSQLKFSFNRVEKEKAFQIAEAGIYYYRWYLAHKTSGKTAQQLDAFWNGIPGPLGVAANFEDDYLGMGEYDIHVDIPADGSTIVTVESEGHTYKMPDVKRKIRVRFRRPAWSEYAILSNSFMNFGDQVEVYGKIHSNAGIHFDGVAYNTISALPARFDDPNYGGGSLEFGVYTSGDPAAPAYPWPAGTVPEWPDIFKGGREFPVPEVSFAGVTADLAGMKVKAVASGNYFNATELGRKIILKNDGFYDVCTVDKANVNTHAITKYSKNSGVGTCNDCNGECLSTYSIPDGGVIFVENDAWVEGSINNKQVTIAAANLSGGGGKKNIYIGISPYNIRYAAYDCNNKLGLVAQQDIRVLNDCPDDFIVDAVLLAQEGAIGINSNFSGKTSITFNGALASYLEPEFLHGNSGFAIRIFQFDNDLLYCSPPYFPTGMDYEIDLWEEL